MKPLLIIGVRTDTPWNKFNRKSFFAQDYPSDKLERYWAFITAWNKISGISFFECRHKLQEIAKQSWENVDGVDDIIYGKQKIYDFMKKASNYNILFTDDDDWYAPKGIKLHTSTAWDKKFDAFSWLGGLYETCNEKGPRFGRVGQKGYLHTNNYGVTNFGFKKFGASKLELVVDRHMTANHLLRGHMNKQVFTVHNAEDKILSVYNKNMFGLSSSTRPGDTLDDYESRIRSDFRKFKLNYKKEPYPEQKYISWSLKYVRQMKKLYKDVFQQ